MKLARKSHTEIELFFRSYYQDKDLVLPDVHIYCGKFAKLLINTIGVHGITFGRRIFVWPELITIDKSGRLSLSRGLAVHEITHVIQYRRHGFAGFLVRYLREYFGNLRASEKWDRSTRQQAYLEISFEVEARDAADQFKIRTSLPDTESRV